MIHSSCWDFNQFYRKLVCEVSSAVPESDDTQMEMEIEGQRNEDSNDIKQFKVGSFQVGIFYSTSGYAPWCLYGLLKEVRQVGKADPTFLMLV